jgi:prevent-host-death family protein
MKKLPVGELKSKFSEVISEVKSGEKIIVTYGKKKESIAVIIPYKEYIKKNIINLGLLKSKKIKIHDDFKMTEEDLLNL